MNISTFFILATILVTLTFTSELHATCINDSQCCTRSSDCCSGCCSAGLCTQVKQGEKCKDPCDLRDPPCGANEKCTLQEVQCIRCPCPPIAVCEPAY